MPAGLDLGTHGLKTRRWADLLRLWDGVVLGRAGFGVDGDLSVIGLHEAVLALHDPALGIGEVLLGLGVWRWGRRGSFPATFAPSLDFLLLICSRLLLKLGFGRSLGLSLQFGLGLPDLRGTPLLVG